MELNSQKIYHYFIYLHTCKTKPYVYVGETTRTPEERWRQQGYEYRGSYFYKIMLENGGWDNWDHVILEEGDGTEIDIDEREKYWTQYYHADDITNYGCVVRQGLTFNTRGSQLTERHKEKISQSLKETFQDPKYHEIFSERNRQRYSNLEERKKTGKKSKEFWDSPEGTIQKEKFREKFSGEGNPFFGKCHTEESREKIREKMGTPVICLETKEIYPSTGSAAKAVGLKSGDSIYNAISGRSKTAGGYHWKYLSDYEPEKWEDIFS